MVSSFSLNNITWSCKDHLSVILGKSSLYTFILHVSQETELGVSTVVLLRRWSWEGYLLVTLGEDAACSLFRSPVRECWANMIILLGTWSWNGRLLSHEIMERDQAQSPLRSSQGRSLWGGMLLKWQILDNFLFMGVWQSWKDWFWSFHIGRVWWFWKTDSESY